jgi:hypothetical protein
VGSPRLRELPARIDAALERGRLPIVVFDLDSTLFTTADRHLRILREFAASHGSAGLRALVADIPPSAFRWTVTAPLRDRGLDDPALLADLDAFWAERFFDGAYLETDTPNPGAVAFVRGVHARGALVYYLTGRHRGGMEVGTVASLARSGFPVADGRVVLHLKATQDEPDHLYKEAAVHAISALFGVVVASFENEPLHANRLREAFPSALHFLVGDVHSPRPVPPHESLVRTDDFVVND